MVGLRLPDGAEREVLRTKWADFSGNVSSYVVRGPLLPTGGAAQGPATPFFTLAVHRAALHRRECRTESFRHWRRRSSIVCTGLSCSQRGACQV